MIVEIAHCNLFYFPNQCLSLDCLDVKAARSGSKLKNTIRLAKNWAGVPVYVCSCGFMHTCISECMKDYMFIEFLAVLS